MNYHISYRMCLVFLFCCIGIMAHAQKYILGGTVLDEKDEPIIGVSVYLKDKAGVGVVTDIDGHFRLTANRGDKIQFSFMGYLKQEKLVLKSNENMVVKMEPDVNALDEVVVEAYGSKTRKITTTGAVTSVDVATLQTPATSLSNMLGGRVAGIISTMQSGEPGQNISEFWVRGIGTFGASSSALVLIDGLEGDLNDVDPADVESFSVLKDASATAVYGVKGANGVVLVTTKRGSEGKLNFKVRANATLSWLKRMPEFCGAYDYAKLVNEAKVVRGESPLYTDSELEIIQYGLDPDLYPDVNWKDEILNDASWQQTYYVSASGGGSIARYFVSLNYSNETAAYKQASDSKYAKGVAYNKFGLRANIDLNMTKTTRLYLGVRANKTINNLPGDSGTDYLWPAVSNLNPMAIPVMYSNGAIPSAPTTDSGNATLNMSPYARLNYTGLTTKEYFSGVYTLSLEQDLSMITKNLKLTVQGAYTNTNWFNETRRVMPELWNYDDRLENGELTGSKVSDKQTVTYSNNQDQYRKYYLQSTLNWGREFGVGHNASALLHYEMSDTKKVSDATDGMNAIPRRYLGLSSRISYNYNETYLFDFNFGWTGSEKFMPGHQFGFFPSISGGWVPSQYKWVKDKFPWINYFKIRASYGIVGNDDISNERFPYLTTITYTNNSSAAWGYKGPTIVENKIGADNLRWEKAKKFDVGIEGKFFKKFDFTVDFFHDYRDGIFRQRTRIPDFVGLVSMPWGNVGKMVSWGSDGTISFTQKINKDVEFTLRGNFTYSVNEIDNFEEADTKYEYSSKNGRPNNYQLGYIALGLFRDQEEINNSPKQTFGGYLPGDIKYKDVNGDGLVNSDDQVPLNFADYPRFMYGFGGEFRWKNLTVGILFKGIGNTYYNRVTTGWSSNMGWIPFYEGKVGNILKIAANPANRWIPVEYNDPSIPASMRENPDAMFPRLSYGKSINNSQTSSFWMGNRKYLRLEEISLSYNWNDKILNRLGIGSIDLSVIANNLCTWDDVKLFDPDQAARNGREYPIPGRIHFQATIKF